MYDCHVHLLPSDYADYTTWRTEGLEGVINASVHVSQWHEVISTSSWPGVTAAAGVHPWYTDEYTDDVLQNLEFLLKEIPALQVGEIGLDFRFRRDSRTEQIEIFRKQLSLAVRYDRLAIVHLLWADRAFLKIMDQFPMAKILIHSCSCDAETVRKIVTRYPNILISFGFNLLNDDSGKRQKALQNVPLHRRRCDSDYPYMHLRGEIISPPTRCALIQRKIENTPATGAL